MVIDVNTKKKCLQPLPKGPATRNDFVNDIVNDARADAIFATLKAIVDDEKSTISLRVAWPLVDSSDDLIASWLMCRLFLMLMCVFE